MSKNTDDNQVDHVVSAASTSILVKNESSTATQEECAFEDFMLKSLDDSHPGVWTRVRLEAGKLIGPMTDGSQNKEVNFAC
jgi:hypothetical protein